MLLFSSKVLLLAATGTFIKPILSAGVATLTLVPQSSVTLTARSEPTDVPAGSITTIPPNGIDIYLSSDTQAAVQKAANANCATPGSLDCQTAIQDALRGQSLQAGQLQPRAAGLIIAGLVVVVGIIVESIHLSNEPIPQAIHIPPEQLSQASNVASATAVVAVPSGGGKTTTFSLPPSPTSAASIPAISIDSSTGDVHIKLTDDQAQAYQNLMGLPGTCSAGQPAINIRKRATSSGTSCVALDANSLMYNAYAFTGLALAFSLMKPPTMPGFSDPAVQAQRTAFLQEWEVAAPAFGVTPDRMDDIAAVAFDLAYIYDTQDLALSTDNVISGSLTDKDKPDCPSQEGNPDNTILVCSLPSCQGKPSEKLCTVDPYKGCTCMNPQTPIEEDFGGLTPFSLQPDALIQILAGPPPDPPSPLTCTSASKTPIPAAYITPDLAYKAYPDFCKGITPGDNWNINSTFYPNTPEFFALVITGSMDSSKWSTDMCNNAFKSILDNCDGNNPKNPMNYKFGGTYDTQGLTFRIQPIFSNRVVPLPTSPLWSCTGSYKGFYDNFGILGVGFASSDFGKNEFFGAIANCIGSKPTAWTFEYFLYDGTPDQHFGFEWMASFHTPIWVRQRCFDNCKVSSNGGGPAWGDSCPGCGGDG